VGPTERAYQLLDRCGFSLYSIFLLHATTLLLMLLLFVCCFYCASTGAAAWASGWAARAWGRTSCRPSAWTRCTPCLCHPATASTLTAVLPHGQGQPPFYYYISCFHYCPYSDRALAFRRTRPAPRSTSWAPSSPRTRPRSRYLPSLRLFYYCSYSERRRGPLASGYPRARAGPCPPCTRPCSHAPCHPLPRPPPSPPSSFVFARALT
jgi:hypothetical protein